MSKLKVGILGFGFMGQTHYTNIQKNEKAEVTAIFSIPLENLPKTIPSSIKLFDDWKKLLDETDVDAFVIATPTHTHAEIAEYIAKKKKHMFIEKPMARTIQQCDKIIKAGKENNIKIFVGHVLRFWPSYSNVKSYIEANPEQFGNLKMVRLQRLSGFPAWSKWFLDVEKSGGVILDLSIHDIDFAYTLYNRIPRSIFAQVKEIDIDGSKLPGISFVNMDFGDGLAYCEATWSGRAKFPFTATAELIGTEGIVKFDGNSTIPVKRYTDSDAINMDPYLNDGYYREMDSFLDSIIHDRETEVSAEDGKNAVALCLAAIKSAELRKPIQMEEILK